MSTILLHVKHVCQALPENWFITLLWGDNVWNGHRISGMARNYTNTIGKRIRLLRQDLGIKQQDLAAAVGVTPSHMSQIEKGQKRPTATMLAAVAKELQTTTDYLLMLDEENERVAAQPEPEPIGYSEQAEEAARVIDSALNNYTRDLCLVLVRAAVEHDRAKAEADEKRVASLLANGTLPPKSAEEMRKLIFGEAEASHTRVLDSLAKETR